MARGSALQRETAREAELHDGAVYNTDPNLGNLLIASDWRLWLVDFSRAFRMLKDLREPENLKNCRLDRRVYDGLRSLDQQTLEAKLGDVLRGPEIAGLLARRDRILEHFAQQIEQRGEQAVICDVPGH